MFKYTDFLIDLLVNSNEYDISIDLISLVVSNAPSIDSHKVHLILSFLDYNDCLRYEAFKILDERINALTVEDLLNILQCFEKDEYKYEIIIKLIKKCLPANDYTYIILTIANDTLQIDIKNIIEKSVTNVQVDNIIDSLKNFHEDERLDLLEKSIAGTGLNLDGSEKHCQELLEVFGENYLEGCDILGIDPDISKQLI